MPNTTNTHALEDGKKYGSAVYAVFFDSNQAFAIGRLTIQVTELPT